MNETPEHLAAVELVDHLLDKADILPKGSYRPAEMQRVLRVSRNTMYRMMNRHEIGYIQVMQQRRITHLDLITYVREHHSFYSETG